jgi:hypothetical protein
VEAWADLAVAIALREAQKGGLFPEMLELIVGVLAALAFPVVVVYVYHRREVWKNRRAGVRRTQKIKLARRDKDSADKGL